MEWLESVKKLKFKLVFLIAASEDKPFVNQQFYLKS